MVDSILQRDNLPPDLVRAHQAAVKRFPGCIKLNALAMAATFVKCFTCPEWISLMAFG
jgi:hypothetical protein